MTTPRTKPRAGQYAAYPAGAPVRVTIGDRLRGLAAVLTIAALLAGLPTLLVLARPAVIPDRLLNPSWVELVLLSNDVQHLVLLLVYAALWIVWGWLAWMGIGESVDFVRRLRAPHLGPLPTGMFARLLTAATMLFAALPVHASTAGPAAAVTILATPHREHETTQTPDDETPGTAAPETEAPPDQAAAAPAPRAPEAYANWEPYVVRQNDTLWKIADTRLGDGRRFLEIHAANRHVLGPEPDYLPAGVTLRVPPAPTPTATESPEAHTVVPGDTLTGIALDHYGDPDRYTTIADASRDTIQPGGERLTDPDHIEPGWTLTLPDLDNAVVAAPAPATTPVAPATTPDAQAPAASPEPDGNAEPADDSANATDTRTTTPDVRHQDLEVAAVPEVRPAPGASDPPSGTPHDEEQAHPAWLLPGLATGGAVLAAGLHVAITRGRSRQARLRPPGRSVAPLPEELIPAVATARVAGAGRVPDVRRLDSLLRELAGPHLREYTQRPLVVAVELTDEETVLHLAQPAELPAPWTGDGLRWTARLADAPESSRQLVPYPMLAAVGQDDRGRAWLLNLEHLRTATVTGDEDAVAAFARHIVAELALNPWTVNLTTHAVGVAEGAQALSQYRVQEHDDDTFTASITRYVRQAAEEEPDGEDHEEFSFVVTASRDGDIADLAAAIREHPGRSSAAVLIVGGTPAPGDVELRIEAGRLHIDALGLDLGASQMSAAELQACASIVAFTRNPADVPNPLVERATGRLRLATRKMSGDGPDGPSPEPAAVVVETGERPADVATPAGEGSLLPEADAAYLAHTANTREDLARLAPVTTRPPAGRDDVGQADRDPTLDQDLADWTDPACRRPRVEVLGKVTMWGPGTGSAVANRRPAFTMLAAFLALHPEGVTLEQVSEVLNSLDGDARSRLAILRGYLGDLPDGTPRLGKGAAGRPRKNGTRPRHLYRIEGLLLDADLLRRLYERAVRRGAQGMNDLVSALELVRGTPFTIPEDKYHQWQWALHGEHLADQYAALVGDVAHLVITHALRNHDLPLARRACETWRAADPGCEALAKDQALLEVADDHPEKAKEIADELWTRFDDELAPTEPGARTAAIDAMHASVKKVASAAQSHTE